VSAGVPRPGAVEGALAEAPAGPLTMSPEMAGAARYYRWTYERIRPHLGEHVLDIGGGFGSHLEPVLASGRRVTSIDRSLEAVAWMERRFAGRPGFRALCADFDAADARRELGSEGFDTVLCLNVLEHIRDDGAGEALRPLPRAARARARGPPAAAPRAVADRDREGAR
jgi:SAM-dependent methyltransferase